MSNLTATIIQVYENYAAIGKFQRYAGDVNVELAGKQFSYVPSLFLSILKCSSAAKIVFLFSGEQSGTFALSAFE